MGLTKCRTWCVGSNKCQKRKKKACECGKYASTSPALEDNCVKTYANAGSFDSLSEWELANAEQIMLQSGIVIAGYDPSTSTNIQNKLKEDAVQGNQNIILLFIAAVLIGIIVFVIYKLFSK